MNQEIPIAYFIPSHIFSIQIHIHQGKSRWEKRDRSKLTGRKKTEDREKEKREICLMKIPQ